MEPSAAAPNPQLPALDADGRSTGTQAIERSLAVLSCFMQAEPELGITDIARVLELSPSTVHRIARALVGAGFLEQNERTNRYHLGRSLLLLGQVAQHSFGLDRAHPIAERLAEETGESVNLGIREPSAGVVALSVASKHHLRFHQPPGTRAPLHASAIGKALLAFGGGGALERELGALAPLVPLTAHTITSVSALRRELSLTRQRGWSFDDEESISGVRCLGAPILGAGGEARAALALQSPSVRMPPARAEELRPALLRAALDIQHALPPLSDR